MRYSQLFGKTKLEAPADADSVNAKMLTQAGFVNRLVAGVYTYLPLGMRVLQKVSRIIREEMNAIGGQEILMPSLHPREIWQQTGRDTTMNEILYRTKGSAGHDFIFAPSHEEAITPLAAQYVQSYKDLPFALYQLQTKFRNEPRAKSGVLRGREFGMKDMYSFHTSVADLEEFYQKSIGAYFAVFKRAGLDAYIIEASGGAFTDQFSHEFAVATPAGEDIMMLCESCRSAQNKEVAKDENTCPKCGKKGLRKEKVVEVGNIFKLGTKYSKDFGLMYTDAQGVRHEVIMGCYGIGTTRLIGTIVEACHDDKGLIWPKSVAPFAVHIVVLSKKSARPSHSEAKQLAPRQGGATSKDDPVVAAAEKLYADLQKQGVEVLLDDREESAGKKLNDADLIGIPLRVVVSAKTLEKNSIEIKRRAKDAPTSRRGTNGLTEPRLGLEIESHLIPEKDLHKFL